MVVPWIIFRCTNCWRLPNLPAMRMSLSNNLCTGTDAGQQDRFIGGGLKYPYVEGLRLDEAMHPLTLMTVGVYGKALPPQKWRAGATDCAGNMALKGLNR